MVSMVMLVVIVLGTWGIVWMRWRREHAYAMPVPPEAPRQTLAHQAFTHGNSCLAAGQCANAITAFHQVRALEPKHPHITGRLAEVERRQHAASATPRAKPPPASHGRRPHGSRPCGRRRHYVRENAGAGGSILRQTGYRPGVLTVGSC